MNLDEIFTANFRGLIHVIWHHLQLNQEPPCPPRLQEGTWRTGRVLTGFLILDLDKIFVATSEGWYMSYDTISRNLHVLETQEETWSKVESWDVGSLWNFHRCFERIISFIYPFQGPPGTLRPQGWDFKEGVFLTGFLIPLSGQLGNPGRDMEERWSLERVLNVWLWWNFHRTTLSSYKIIESQGRDMEER